MSLDTGEPLVLEPAADRVDRIVVDIVVPVSNEEYDLETSVRRLWLYLRQTLPLSFRITIADNASVDVTPAIAAQLAAELPEVTSFRMAEKGRGRALKAVWSASDAQVLAYCDGDLSTDLTRIRDQRVDDLRC